MLATNEMIEKYHALRNARHNHVEGDTLYYHDQYMNADRPGTVKQRILHYGLAYYVLEVEVPVVGDSFLHLASEFQVRVTPKDVYKGR